MNYFWEPSANYFFENTENCVIYSSINFDKKNLRNSAWKIIKVKNVYEMFIEFIEIFKRFCQKKNIFKICKAMNGSHILNVYDSVKYH